MKRFKKGQTIKFLLNVNPDLDPEIPSLNTALTKEIVVGRPDKTEITITATVVGTWELTAKLPSSETDDVGDWGASPKVDYGEDNVIYGDTVFFRIEPVIVKR